jgi:hypothetical protein
VRILEGAGTGGFQLPGAGRVGSVRSPAPYP